MHQPVALFSDTLVQRLAQARRVAVLTGAGISAESGVPTFRDPGGLWKQFKPEELANVDAFLANPELVQGWYRHRREVVEQVQPNAGHRALAELEQMVTERGGEFLLATQNVDGLHQRTGSEAVVELHGSIVTNRCVDCHQPAPGPTDDELARCPACNGLVRPDVVWFGEMLPEAAIERASIAAQRADVYLSIGTSSVVYPAAGLPQMAKQSGAYVAEINPTPSEIAWRLDEQVRGAAGAVLPELVASVSPRNRGDMGIEESSHIEMPETDPRTIQYYTDLRRVAICGSGLSYRSGV